MNVKDGDAMRVYDELTAGWDNLLECLRIKEEPDVESIRRLIFETYHFEKQDITGDYLPRNRLGLYKRVAQFCESLSESYPAGMTESVSDTCEAFAVGLCYVIENGFDCGYGANPLPIGLTTHTPAGCAEPEADMTTYESFAVAFQENVEWLRDEYDEE